MAADTATKRLSATGNSLTFLRSLPLPDGAVDASDRFQAIGFYAITITAFESQAEGTTNTLYINKTQSNVLNIDIGRTNTLYIEKARTTSLDR